MKLADDFINTTNKCLELNIINKEEYDLLKSQYDSVLKYESDTIIYNGIKTLTITLLQYVKSSLR